MILLLLNKKSVLKNEGEIIRKQKKTQQTALQSALYNARHNQTCLWTDGARRTIVKVRAVLLKISEMVLEKPGNVNI